MNEDRKALLVIRNGLTSIVEGLNEILKEIEPKGPVATTTKQTASIKDMRSLFPSELEEMLEFTEEKGSIKIRPRQFLGSENFAKIASIIREAGGEYVSAGKESHFRL